MQEFIFYPCCLPVYQRTELIPLCLPHAGKCVLPGIALASLSFQCSSRSSSLALLRHHLVQRHHCPLSVHLSMHSSPGIRDNPCSLSTEVGTKCYMQPVTASASKWAVYPASRGHQWGWKVLLSPAFPNLLPLPTCAQQSQGTVIGCFNYLRSLLLSGVT